LGKEDFLVGLPLKTRPLAWEKEENHKATPSRVRVVRPMEWVVRNWSELEILRGKRKKGYTKDHEGKNIMRGRKFTRGENPIRRSIEEKKVPWGCRKIRREGNQQGPEGSPTRILTVSH